MLEGYVKIMLGFMLECLVRDLNLNAPLLTHSNIKERYFNITPQHKYNINIA